MSNREPQIPKPSPRSFFIHTMGCQMNAYDSDYLAQSLLAQGYRPADDPRRADVILINTCTVRSKPEQKAYSLIGRMADIKRRRPGVVLGVVGCVAQKEGAGLKQRFPYLDLVAGPRELARITDILNGQPAAAPSGVYLDLRPGPPQPARYPGYFEGRVTGRIAVMEGCDNFCSYCAVPLVRGREVSRAPEEILREAGTLIAEGIREITLLGQNVNSYLWRGRGEERRFPGLLNALDSLAGLLRLRFTTSHPKDLSGELIRCFRDLPRLCGHIHLPFQAGSNRVLQGMRRGYTREHYLDLVEELRRVNPEIAISSDVMVGFPGETAEDFRASLDLIEQVRFDSLFSFKYSDRKGTLADRMEPKLREEEKAARLEVLQALQKKITLRKNRQLEDRTLEVLVEGESRRGGQFSGRTSCNKIVNFMSDRGCIGQLVKVRIKNARMNSLQGELAG